MAIDIKFSVGVLVGVLAVVVWYKVRESKG